MNKYEALRRELDDGEITQKGFDSRVKALLKEAEEKGGPSETPPVPHAANVFGAAKDLVKGMIKKKQYPLKRPGPKEIPGKPLYKVHN